VLTTNRSDDHTNAILVACGDANIDVADSRGGSIADSHGGSIADPPDPDQRLRGGS
jgi:hypothetical protein